MVSDNMLTHMAVPASPADREEAVGATFEAYEALYYAHFLREWADYHADGEREEIARAYRDDILDRLANGLPDNRYVTVYAHTEEAADVLADALYDVWDQWRDGNNLHPNLGREIEDKIIGVWGEHHDDEEDEE